MSRKTWTSVSVCARATFDHIDLESREHIFRMATSDRSDSPSANILALCKDLDTELMSMTYAVDPRDEKKEIKCDPSSPYRYGA